MMNNSRDRAFLVAYAEAVKSSRNVSISCSSCDGHERFSGSITHLAQNMCDGRGAGSSKNDVPPKSQCVKRVHFRKPIDDEIEMTDLTQLDHMGGDCPASAVDGKFTSYVHSCEDTSRMYRIDEGEYFYGVVVERELTSTVRTRKSLYGFYDVPENHWAARNGKRDGGQQPPTKFNMPEAGNGKHTGSFNVKSTEHNRLTSYKSLRTVYGALESTPSELFINAKDDLKGRPDVERSSFVHHSSSTKQQAYCPKWLCPCSKKLRNHKQLMTPLILINYTKSTPEKTHGSWKIHKTYEWHPRHLNDVGAIHEGIFSNVKVVQHRKSGEFAALKVVFKKNSHHSFYEIEKTVRVERSILEYSLGNPLFVNLKAFYETSDRWCFLSEYLPLGDLAAYVQEWTLNDDQILSISAQMVSALRFLHKIDIIHRDVKSENILLDSDRGHVKLIDFGLAHIGRTSRRMCGTPVFMAPEMLLNKEYNNAVDWWSLGIVIFECLVGCTPTELHLQKKLDDFSDDEVLEYCKEGCLLAVKLIPDSVSEEMRRLLTGFLELEPNKRLGCKPYVGFFEIWSHPYFSSVNLEKVASKGEFCSCPFLISPQRRTTLLTSDKV